MANGLEPGDSIKGSDTFSFFRGERAERSPGQRDVPFTDLVDYLNSDESGLEAGGNGVATSFENYDTAGRDALTSSEGDVIFNTDTKSVNVYTGTAWSSTNDYIDTIETSLSDLTTNYPPADYDGFFAWIQGTIASDKGLYFSNGTLWELQVDNPGARSNLFEALLGASDGSTNELLTATYYRRDASFVDTTTPAPIGALSNIFDNDDDTDYRVLGDNSGEYIFAIPSTAKVCRKFTIRITTSGPYTLEVWGFTSASAGQKLGLVSIENITAGSPSIIVDDQISTGAAFFDVITDNTGTAYAGYGMRIVAAGADNRYDVFRAFEYVDNSTGASHTTAINKVHAGNSANTGGTALTADTLLDNDDYIVELDATAGAFTMTLPAVGTVLSGKRYIFKKIDASANAITLDGDGSETIDGATTNATALAAQWDAVEIISNGTEWLIIGAHP